MLFEVLFDASNTSGPTKALKRHSLNGWSFESVLNSCHIHVRAIIILKKQRSTARSSSGHSNEKLECLFLLVFSFKVRLAYVSLTGL